MSADLLPGEGLIYLPLTDISEGDRVRTDLGNIKELADSIASVGLLHPIVITPKRRLVAGGRRLSAVRSLGWVEVPVRVVDITTAEKALRAEADENTCRKGLTPYEASDMRRRQAEVLAPIAAENKGGRPSNTGTKLEPVSPPSQRKVKNAASIGTGYSGSSLDKVDRIRDVAERGVIRKGRTEVPAPAPVVEIAKRSLAAVKQTGAAIEPSVKAVDAAIEQFVGDDPAVKRARFRKTYFDAVKQSTALLGFDPHDVAAAINDAEFGDLQSHLATFTGWVNKVTDARGSGLRAIQGGRR